MNQALQKPEFLLFAQHGWSDNGNDIGKLAKTLVTDKTLVFAPSLGLLNTYWRIASLIEKVESLASQQIKNYPHVPLKIMGHSMGGLIWLEVLNRHPEWWHKVHSLIVLGSPIGGADLARAIDPLKIGIGIARDLGTNRREIAEKVARNIPTLSIASDLGFGSDGMVPLAATKFAYSQFVCVDDIPHARLKCHPNLIPLIQKFWLKPEVKPLNCDLTTNIIRRLQNIPGMTDANYRYFERSQTAVEFSSGIKIRLGKNMVGVDRVFVTDREDRCLYGGYVGWLHKVQLQQTLKQLSEQV